MNKMKMNVSVKQLGDPEERVLRFTGSDESEDRDSDIIRSSGWELIEYMKNPIFLYMHDYKIPPIGKAVNVFVDSLKKALVFDIKFPTIEELSTNGLAHEHAKFADMIYNMYLNGYMNSTSVGFKGIDFSEREDQKDLPSWARGIEFRKQELFELSGVTVPANPNANIIRGMKSFANDDEIKTFFDMSKWNDEEWTELSKSLISNKGELQDNGVVANDPAEISEEKWSASDVRNGLEPIELAEHSLIWNNLKSKEDLLKSDSKLPHHEIDGKVNKQALIAMKAAILGARGGVIPFPEQTQEDFDKQIETAIVEHANEHFKAADLEEIDVEEMKSLTLDSYSKEFEKYFDIKTIIEIWESKTIEDAYEMANKTFDNMGNPSSYDIERAIDIKLNENQEMYNNWVSEFYPINYPNGHAIVRYSGGELKLHNYTYQIINGNTIVELDDGVDIALTYDLKSISQKAGAALSKKNKDSIIKAVEILSSMIEDDNIELDDNKGISDLELLNNILS